MNRHRSCLASSLNESVVALLLKRLQSSEKLVPVSLFHFLAFPLTHFVCSYCIFAWILHEQYSDILRSLNDTWTTVHHGKLRKFNIEGRLGHRGTFWDMRVILRDTKSSAELRGAPRDIVGHSCYFTR